MLMVGSGMRGTWVGTFAGPLAVFSIFGVFAVGGLSGCGSKTPPPDNQSFDADFSVCSGTPAVHYAPGMSVRSASGAYLAAIESAVTTLNDQSQISTAAIGSDDLTVVVTAASADPDAGVADAAGGVDVAGLAMTSTALPWMPVHMHGASSLPTVTAQSGGAFAVTGIGFFMGGYWQVPLNLVPASGAPDAVLFSICIPDD